jgi:hypothetical protein
METTERFYKRWWFWVLVLVLLLVAVISFRNYDVYPTAQKVSSTPDAIHKVAEAITVGDSIITVNEVTFSQGDEYGKPNEGNQWVNLNITIENISSTQQFLSTLRQMYLRDGSGGNYQVAVTDKELADIKNKLDGAVMANSTRTGWVGFEVPKGAAGLQLEYNGSTWGGTIVLVNLDQGI